MKSFTTRRFREAYGSLPGTELQEGRRREQHLLRPNRRWIRGLPPISPNAVREPGTVSQRSSVAVYSIHPLLVLRSRDGAGLRSGSVRRTLQVHALRSGRVRAGRSIIRAVGARTDDTRIALWEHQQRRDLARWDKSQRCSSLQGFERRIPPARFCEPSRAHVCAGRGDVRPLRWVLQQARAG